MKIECCDHYKRFNVSWTSLRDRHLIKNMKILMTGATGLIGSQLGIELIRQGHEIIIFSRSLEEAKLKAPFAQTILEWDFKTPKNFPELKDIDGVIHLAGESVASGRWTKARKKRILDSRVDGTRALIATLDKSECSYLQFIAGASAIGHYGDAGDRMVNEASPAGKDFLAITTVEWEKALFETPLQIASPRRVALRLGIVLSAMGGALQTMLPIFQQGLGGVLGSGEQWMSWVHIEDVIRAFQWVTQKPVSGVFNVVASNPVKNRNFVKLLARALDKPYFFSTPGLILRIALGEMSQIILFGQRVENKKIMREGFQFKFLDLGVAFSDLLSAQKRGLEVFKASQVLPKKRKDVFSFFCDEKNLEALTPKMLNFHILKKSTADIQQGTLIDYQLKIRGVPAKWRTLIKKWDPPYEFQDVQLKGPYHTWEHTHRFEDLDGARTLMTDVIYYRVPLGILGRLVSGSFVRKDVSNIFTFRRKTIEKIFGSISST